MTDEKNYGLPDEWFTPRRCTWTVQDDFIHDDPFLPVYPNERPLQPEDVEYVRAQLNRTSEEGYFGFSVHEPAYEGFVQVLAERLNHHVDEHGDFESPEGLADLRHALFGAMAQIFWE